MSIKVFTRFYHKHFDADATNDIVETQYPHATILRLSPGNLDKLANAMVNAGFFTGEYDDEPNYIENPPASIDEFKSDLAEVSYVHDGDFMGTYAGYFISFCED